MIAWWQRRVDHVRGSTALRWYGACLAAIHLLTFVYWDLGGFAARILGDRSPVCWPFFEDCSSAHVLSKHGVETALWLYGIGASATILAFTRRRYVGVALVLLTAVNLAKGALFILDYRFMGNYHYMPFIITALYLMWPRPEQTIGFVLVAFYVSAGALKLDKEWLSGAALIAPTWLSGKLLELACAYVVILELVLVFGLLSRHRWVRWVTVGQLAIFHAYSWHVVGFFYPCVMGLLLAWYPLRWLEVPEEDGLGGRLANGRAGAATYAILALYAAAQLAPTLFSGDSAITGEGRIFALNMMDAKVECDHFQLVRTTVGDHVVIEETTERRTDVGVRIKCDPIRFWNIARTACREHAALGDDARIDAYLDARRTTDPAYRSVFAVEDICNAAPHFDIWRHNSWLEPRSPPVAVRLQ